MAAIHMLQDPFYRRCIDLAQRSDKEREHYGALFVKKGHICGEGWNRDTLPEDLVKMGPILHAEGASLNDTLRLGFDPAGGEIFVAGYFLSDHMLNIRTGAFFTCDLCPGVLAPYGITHLNVPTVDGWRHLTLDEALTCSKDLMVGLVGEERSRKRRTIGATGVYLDQCARWTPVQRFQSPQ